MSFATTEKDAAGEPIPRDALQHDVARRHDHVHARRLLGVDQVIDRIDADRRALRNVDRHAVSGSDHAPRAAAAGIGPCAPRRRLGRRRAGAARPVVVGGGAGCRGAPPASGLPRPRTAPRVGPDRAPGNPALSPRNLRSQCRCASAAHRAERGRGERHAACVAHRPTDAGRRVARLLPQCGGGDRCCLELPGGDQPRRDRPWPHRRNEPRRRTRSHAVPTLDVRQIW